MDQVTTLAVVRDTSTGWTEGERHPWLTDAAWFTEASDRLLEALDPGDMIEIGLDAQRDRDPTAGVHIHSARTVDELDDMPGLRRIERRAPELSQYMPTKTPLGAQIKMTSDDLVVHLRWHHIGQAALLCHRRETGWQSADMIIIPSRYIHVSEEDLATKDHAILTSIDRVLGGNRIDPKTQFYAAYRREEEIRVIIGAGGILHPGFSGLS